MRVLFLQVLPSAFFFRLAVKFRNSGHSVYKINFSGGDMAFWNIASRSFNYKGTLDNLPEYYKNFLDKHHIDSVLLFGDCRPVHKAVMPVCKDLGIDVYVFEEGYLRPNWITMDYYGTNWNSRALDDLDCLRKSYDRFLSQGAYDNGEAVRSYFIKRAANDFVYNVCNSFLKPFFPGYKSHRPEWIYREYSGFVKRFLKSQKYRKKYLKICRDTIRKKEKFFLVPLQLDSDYQIREHSRFSSMHEFLETVFLSFRNHASKDSKLLVKLHPLDNGIQDYCKITMNLAREHGLEKRVKAIDYVNLPSLLRTCRGVILVNSTVGFSALMNKKPVITLGKALYDMPGITYQGNLNHFWLDAETFSPDKNLVNALRNLLIEKTQVNGGYFSQDGVRLSVDNAYTKILKDKERLNREKIDKTVNLRVQNVQRLKENYELPVPLPARKVA